MSTESDAEVFYLPGEYEEADAAPQPQPRHARPPRLARRAVAMLSLALIFTFGLSVYLWQQLDNERSNRAVADENNAQFEAALSDTEQRVAETQKSLDKANDQLEARNADITKLERQIENAQQRASDLKKKLEAANADLDESQATAEDLARAVLAVADLTDSCNATIAELAENIDGYSRFGRGALAQRAREAARICGAAAQSARDAVPAANSATS